MILKDKEYSGQSKKFEDTESQTLWDENSARMLEELNVGKSIVFN